MAWKVSQYYVGFLLLICFSRTARSFSPCCGLSSVGRRESHLWLAADAKSGEEKPAKPQSNEERLYSLLSYLDTYNGDRLPCGLDCTEKEQKVVAAVLADLEKDDASNLLPSKKGKIVFDDLYGDWDLLYTSSRTMLINKSLSGLGRSSSTMANFSGLIQKFGGNKFLGKIEFIETIGAGEDAVPVSVVGEWLLSPETDIFTGAPTTSIDVDPSTITYGPSENAANDWSSLGPIKRLDIVYFSDELMVSRGNANPESLFVWKRKEE